jgi:hypothetical protein
MASIWDQCCYYFRRFLSILGDFLEANFMIIFPAEIAVFCVEIAKFFPHFFG